jgi:hypothetical protein
MKRLIPPALALALAACAAQAQPPAGDIGIARAGSQASVKGPAANFTGSVRVDPLFVPQGPARSGAAWVTFEPGARSAWRQALARGDGARGH